MDGAITELRVWRVAVPPADLRARKNRHKISFADHDSLRCSWGMKASRDTRGYHIPWVSYGTLDAHPGPAELRPKDKDGGAGGAGSGAGGDGSGAGGAGAGGGADAGGGVDDITAATSISASGGTVMVTCERGAFVRIGNTAQLGLVGSSYTVETWVRLHEYSGDDGEQRDNAILGSDTLRMYHTPHMVLRRANPYFGHFCADCAATVPVSLREWHHLAFVYDKLLKDMLIYMDGRQVCRSHDRRPLEGQSDLNVELNVGRYAGAQAQVMGARECLSVGGADAVRALINVALCNAAQVAAPFSATLHGCACGARRCGLMRLPTP